MLIDDNGWEKWNRLRKVYNQTKSEFIKSIINQFWKKHMLKFNSWIPLSANIDETVLFPHGISGVYISSLARIGGGYSNISSGNNRVKHTKRVKRIWSTNNWE